MRLPPFLSCFLLVLAACGSEAPDNTPASIALTPSTPLTVQSGLTTTITARILNRGGSPVTGSTVTWSTSDPSVAIVAGGVVTGAKAGTATITASTPTSGTPPTVTASLGVSVTPGVPTQLAMRTQPLGASIGLPLATQPEVEIRDAAGNLVTSSTATVTASIAEGGGTLVGSASATAVAGVARFSGLAINGFAGPRTLNFASTGLTAVTSARFTITPPPTPVIVLDTNTITLLVPRGTTPAPMNIGVTNGGFAPLGDMTLDPVEYDPNQATGWLTARLSGGTAPATITLTFTTTDLVEGGYRARVRLNAPGASNSPATLTVNVTVRPNYIVSYGTSAEKVRILDPGSSFSPSVAVTDARGPVTGVALTFISRATSVATVGSDGRITAVGEGDAWIVVTSEVSNDSVFVVVPRSNGGPVVRSNVTTWFTRLGDTLTATVFLDTRSATVGAASLAIAVQPLSGSFTFLFAAAAGSPSPVVSLVSTSQTGGPVIRVVIGSATGMSGSIPLVTFRIVGRTVGTTGLIALTALDVSGVDASSLTANTSSTRIPFVFR
jgi:hypothetical protein